MIIKKIYENMIDYRQFGMVLLAVGAFFFIGSIIPNDGQIIINQNIAVITSFVFLIMSMVFLGLSKNCRKKLIETEEGQEYLIKKKRP
ncbi:YrhC family protein [Mesobacillus maritimus]|uniref:YrhC family protein n=1 Tax=Mesobacillus maritimus TaxID=1643336 RepID=UPI0025595079|nr:YrhC family protein [Mesobacillus maritimus]